MAAIPQSHRGPALHPCRDLYRHLLRLGDLPLAPTAGAVLLHFLARALAGGTLRDVAKHPEGRALHGVDRALPAAGAAGLHLRAGLHPRAWD